VVLKAMCGADRVCGACIDVRPVTFTKAAAPADSLLDKCLFPRRPGYFSPRNRPARSGRVRFKAELERWNQRQTGQGHGTHRDLGNKYRTAETHRTAGSGGVCGLLQSPPRRFCSLGSAYWRILNCHQHIALLLRPRSSPRARMRAALPDLRRLSEAHRGRLQDKQMSSRTGPGSMRACMRFFAWRLRSFSESLTAAHYVRRARPVPRLSAHPQRGPDARRPASVRSTALPADACRIALAETVAARLGRLLLELAHQIGEHLDEGGFRFPYC